MPSYRTLDQAELRGKRVLLRAGFDVPVEDGKVTDASRIEAILPTMRRILDGGASMILLSYQGRPKGKPDPAFSQRPLVPVLEKLLKAPVGFAESCTGDETLKLAAGLKPGAVLLLENLRFDPREEANDPGFARELAALGDLYVNDAFPQSHRTYASTVALAGLLPAYMGLQLQKEVEHLGSALSDPRRPVALIISGAKMETKVPVVERFLTKGDDILLGGAIANTFLAARGFDIGTSKFEPDFVDTAQTLMLESEKEGRAKVHVPRDAVVASTPAEDAPKLDLPVEDVMGDMAIFDVGKVTIERYLSVIEKAGTVVWNGPLGLYEYNRFSHATKRVAEALAVAAKRGATVIVGGGDTIDFHVRYGYPLDAYTFVSTGGGAMLEFVSGKPFPALAALQA